MLVPTKIETNRPGMTEWDVVEKSCNAMLDKEFLCVLSFIMQDHQVPGVPSIDEKSKRELKFIFFTLRKI